MNALLLLVIIAICTFGFVFSEVTVLKSVQTIYDRSPKLRIKGTGFDADEHDITLDLAATGQPSLRADKDFLISKDPDGEGIILKLLSARRYGWPANFFGAVHLNELFFRTPRAFIDFESPIIYFSLILFLKFPSFLHLPTPKNTHKISPGGSTSMTAPRPWL